jgi:hypothetical protein
MRRTVIAAVALLLLLAVLGVLMHQRTRRPGPGSAAAPAAAPASAPAVRPAQRPAVPRGPLRLMAAAVAPDEHAPGGSFEGRVVSALTGRGIARAEVTFERAGAAASVASGTDGSFRFAPALAGGYVLATVTAEGFLPFAPDWGQSPIRATLVAGTRIRDAVIALTPAVEYVGAVVDPARRPVAGAAVRIIDNGAGEQALAPLGEQFVSDAMGEFRFRAPDGALLEARHPAWAPGRARLDFGAQVSHRLMIALRPSGPAPAETITGRVVRTDGVVVPGAAVVAEHRPATPAAAPVGPALVRAVSDDDGRFTLAGLVPDEYDVWAAAAGQVSPRAHAPAGARDLTLRLGAAARLQGAVRDASGAPVVAFAVVLARRLGPLEMAEAAPRTFFDPRGRYVIDDLEPGPYRMLVAAHGFAPTPLRDVAVTVPTTEADFTLAGGARLTGFVLEAGTRAPLAGATVSVEGRAALGDLPLAARVTTDASGAFTLTGLAPGRCSVFAAASGHHARILSGLLVEAAAVLGPVTLELTRLEPGEEPRIELCGIGVVLAAKDDALVVGTVVPGGGAAAAGLKAGDAVVRVDGQPVVTLGFDTAIQLIRGPEGSTVVLTIRRADGSVAEVPVVRRPVRS